MTRFGGTLFAFLLGAALQAQIPAPAGYSATDLGSLGGGGTEPLAINKNAVVTGSSMTQAGQQHAFVWHDERMKDIATLGVASEGTAINDAGVVVGWYQISVSAPKRGFIFTGNHMRDLGVLPGGKSTVPNGMNNRMQVVGCADTPTGEIHAFLWHESGLIDLGTPGVTSCANDINDSGRIVGYTGPPNSVSQVPGTWQAGSGNNFTPLPHSVAELGEVVGGTAKAINRDGVVLGYATQRGELYLVQWDGTGAHKETFAALPGGINAKSEIAAQMLAVHGRRAHHWGAYILAGNVTDLFDQPSLSSANAINDSGLIVGTFAKCGVGCDPPHGYVLIPLSSRKDVCANDNWKSFSSAPGPFLNYGQCVSKMTAP